jgi:glycine/D-amino acid oxidase-like deaminating enzyme
MKIQPWVSRDQVGTGSAERADDVVAATSRSVTLLRRAARRTMVHLLGVSVIPGTVVESSHRWAASPALCRRLASLVRSAGVTLRDLTPRLAEEAAEPELCGVP